MSALIFAALGVPVLSNPAEPVFEAHWSSSANTRDVQNAVFASKFEDLVTKQGEVDSADVSTEVMRGLTESFLGGSVSDKERQCISEGASSLAKDVVAACDLAVESAKAMFVPRFAEGAAVGAPELTTGEETFIALDGTAKLAAIYKLEHKLAKACLQDEALRVLTIAGQHQHNMSFVGGQLRANGVDIMAEVSSAVFAYDDKHYYLFGQEMGNAWRKVLLAQDTRASNLPTPPKDALQEVTESFLSTLFKRGSSLQVLMDGMPAASADRAYAQEPEQPTEVFSVDLHECVRDNLKLFQQVWAPIQELFENAPKIGECSVFECTVDLSEAPVMSSLASSTSSLQTALEKCDISREREALIVDSLFYGSQFETRLDLPESRMQEKKITEEMVKAIQDWRAERWAPLGERLGGMLRSTLVVVFPQEYAIDESGELRRQVLNASHASPQVMQSALKGFGAAVMAVLVSAAALVALRSWRVKAAGGVERLSSGDLEQCVLE